MTEAEGYIEAVLASQVIQLNIQDLDKNNHDFSINEEDLGITVFQMKQQLPTIVMKEKAPEYIDLCLVIGRDESVEEEIKMEDERILQYYFNDLTSGHIIKLVEKRKTWTNDVMYYKRKLQERGQRDAKLLVISAVVVLVAAVWLYA